MTRAAVLISRAVVVAVVVLVGVALVGVPRAHAHLGHVILNAERYLKLDIADDEVRVVVSLTLGASEGQRVLRAADTNQDGQVDRSEADRYLDEWGTGLATELPITVEGHPRAATWSEGFLSPRGPVRAVPVTVELVAHVPLGGGVETIRVTDRMVRRDVYDRTDVAFRTRDEARLLASGADADPSGVVRELSYQGGFLDGAPVPLVARVETPVRPSRRPPLWVAGVGLLVLVLLGVFQYRRRR